MVIQDVTIRGNWMKGALDLSELFLQLLVSLHLFQNKKLKKYHTHIIPQDIAFAVSSTWNVLPSYI